MRWDTPAYINGQPHSNSNPVGHWFDNPPIGGICQPEMVPVPSLTPRGSTVISRDPGYLPPGVTLWPDGPGVWPDR